MHRKKHQFQHREAPHFMLIGGTVVPTYPHYASWMYPLWNYGGGYMSTATNGDQTGDGWTAQQQDSGQGDSGPTGGDASGGGNAA